MTPTVELPEVEVDEFLESKLSTLVAVGVAAGSLLLAAVALVFAWDVQQDWKEFQAEADLTRDTQVDALRGGSVVLDALATTDLGVQVDVDQIVPIDAQVPFQREYSIPIRTVLPIRDTVSTTIELPGWFGSSQRVPVQIPIEIDVPLEVDVPFMIDETIDLSAEVPLEATIPLELDLGATTLGSLASQYGARLDASATALEGDGAAAGANRSAGPVEDP
jgi:hypothetical protein